MIDDTDTIGCVVDWGCFSTLDVFLEDVEVFEDQEDVKDDEEFEETSEMVAAEAPPRSLPQEDEFLLLTSKTKTSFTAAQEELFFLMTSAFLTSMDLEII